jgi:hypothetical protein
MNGRAYGVIAVLVPALGVAAWLGLPKSAATQGAAQIDGRSRPYVRTFDPMPTRVSGVLLVNDQPDAYLHTGVPLFVRLTLSNPSDRAVALNREVAPRLDLQSETGATVEATFNRVGDLPLEIPASNTIVIEWTTEDALAAGRYTMAVSGTEAWPRETSHRLWIPPVTLAIASTPDAAEREAASIRIVLMTQGAEPALARLERARAADPDTLQFLLLRADCLEILGRAVEAREALHDLARQISARQRDGSQPGEVPDWLALRLGRTQ